MKLTSKGLSTFRKLPLKKKLFSINKFCNHLKNNQKPKSSRVVISSLITNKLRSTNISKEKINRFKITSSKVNPFKEKSKKRKTQKKRNISKPLSSKGQEFKFNFTNFKKRKDFWENNYLNEDLSELNNMMPTIETETNQYMNNKDFNLDELYHAFKNSELKSTIILDNCGNNNLNCEQKKIIDNYFDKKRELEKNIQNCKINIIKVERYNCNDIHIKQNKSQMNNSNKKNINNLKIKELHQNKTKIQISLGKKILSMKENLRIRDLLEIKDEKDKESKFVINSDDNELEENNSIFENCQKNLNDSSFISSSEGEDIVMAFNEK